MPYIQINVTQTLEDQQKELLKARLGEDITLIPGKTEAVTMVDIADGRTIYMGGKPVNGGFIEVRLYGIADLSCKKAMTEAFFNTMEQLLGIKPDDLYLSISEFSNWGAHGRLK